MLNITIQNNGRIEIQSVCADTKEMRYNVNLLLALALSMETKENVDKKNDVTSNESGYYLYLKGVEDNNRLSTVEELSKLLGISLQDAKSTVDSVVNGRKLLLTKSFKKAFVDNIKDALESKGCTCEITDNDDESNRSEDYISAQTIYYLYLDKVERNDRVSAVRMLRDKLNIPLERAKAIVNTASADKHADILLSQSPDSNYIATIRDALESVGCICQTTEG